MNPRNTQRVIFAWTLTAAVIVLHQVSMWRGGVPIETDLLSLLPSDGRDDTAEKVLAHLGESASRSVVVLLTAKEKPQALAAADAFVAAVKTPKLERVLAPPAGGTSPLEEFAPWREYLLTPAQLERLKTTPPEALTDQALQQLQQPVGARFGDFREDPLQLFPEYLRERAKVTKVRPEGEHLVFESDAGHHVLLRFKTVGGAFSLDGNAHLDDALALGRAALPAGVEAVTAGVPLFAEAAAVQANQEVSTVGFGSLAAILVIMFLAFRSPRPLLLVVLSVGMGVVAGLSATVALFGKVHLMTMVFGASLVGVAEDYGIHYFASRQAAPNRDPRDLLNELTPGLFLAMITSVAGYVVLGLAPFPGIRQLAVFSSAGLLAAYLTVVAWYPLLDRGVVKHTRFADAWARTRRWWPMLSGAKLLGFIAVCLAIGGVGLWKLEVRDDIRALQASPPALIEAQKIVSDRIGLPSPAQFFIVRGGSEGERLAREEALTAKLDAFKARGVLGGYDALSVWVPSPAKQLAQREVFRTARKAVLSSLSEELEDTTPVELDTPPMTLGDAMKTKLGEALTPLSMKDANVVLLHSPSKEALAEFATLNSLEGVRFIDRTGDISLLMQRWRVGMSWLMVLGYVLTFGVLWPRFKKDSWRAVVPTALSSLLALAAVAFLGESLTLFHVLSLWLLLGMGVDYGIFLVEHPGDSGEAWLAVGLGAISTLLSFGLLAVSKTPAIHAFGVTLGVGVTVVWLISPLFSLPPRHEQLKAD